MMVRYDPVRIFKTVAVMEDSTLSETGSENIFLK